MTKLSFSTIALTLICLPFSSLLSAAQTEPASALRVEYHQWKIGKDGVKQDLSYTENLYRQENLLWLEREIPEAAQRDHDTHSHGGLAHKHADVVGAPL